MLLLLGLLTLSAVTAQYGSPTPYQVNALSAANAGFPAPYELTQQSYDRSHAAVSRQYGRGAGRALTLGQAVFGNRGGYALPSTRPLPSNNYGQQPPQSSKGQASSQPPYGQQAAPQSAASYGAPQAAPAVPQQSGYAQAAPAVPQQFGYAQAAPAAPQPVSNYGALQVASTSVSQSTYGQAATPAAPTSYGAPAVHAQRPLATGY